MGGYGTADSRRRWGTTRTGKNVSVQTLSPQIVVLLVGQFEKQADKEGERVVARQDLARRAAPAR
jgi:hypothetical protein